MPLLPDLPRRGFFGIVYRAVRQGLDPLSVAGSLRAGGRFNPPGGFGALYTSVEEATAAAEVARGLRQRGIDPSEYPEGYWWMYELEVRLDSVLDLTDASILEKCGISAASLTGGDMGASRAIGAEAKKQGYQALLVPSAAISGSANLVLIVDNLSTTPVGLSSRAVSLE